MGVANAPVYESPPGPGTGKRPRDEDENIPAEGAKVRRLSRSSPTPRASGRSPRNEAAHVLPSPSLSKCDQSFPRPPLSPSPQDRPVSQKGKVDHLDFLPAGEQAQPASKTEQTQLKLSRWLSNLANEEDFESHEIPRIADDMSQSAPKRSRSSESLGGGFSTSGYDTESTFSKEKKFSMYRDSNYGLVLETKGSFMRPSKAGMLREDKELCERLLTTSQPIVNDDMFSDDYFEEFHANLHGRSKAQIYLHLHPRLVPSVENLFICGREEFAGFREGINDLWDKSIPFYGSRPQPDHTFGFKWSNFTEEQRSKLRIDPTEVSLYAPREDIYFPFLTAEVKCGAQGFGLAEKPNLHSMTVHMRGIVDLYRRVKRPSDVHRRVLGFSISHDDRGVRIHAYYPEINGDRTTYWRETLTELLIGNDHGRDRWLSYQFTLNVCQLFALPLLERLKALIDEIPDPLSQSAQLVTAPDDAGEQGPQDGPGVPDTQNQPFKKPRAPRNSNAELRSTIDMLQRQLERQTEVADRKQQQMERQTDEAERRQREAIERDAKLSTELERQRKRSEQQFSEFMEMLKEQREMMKAQREELRAQREQSKAHRA